MAFALFHPSARAALDLAFLSAGELRVIETLSGDRALAGKGVRVDVALEDATGLAAADLDGDRVVDLAVADQQNIVILQAQLVER